MTRLYVVYSIAGTRACTLVLVQPPRSPQPTFMVHRLDEVATADDAARRAGQLLLETAASALPVQLPWTAIGRDDILLFLKRCRRHPGASPSWNFEQLFGVAVPPSIASALRYAALQEANSKDALLVRTEWLAHSQLQSAAPEALGDVVVTERPLRVESVLDLSVDTRGSEHHVASALWLPGRKVRLAAACLEPHHRPLHWLKRYLRSRLPLLIKHNLLVRTNDSDLACFCRRTGLLAPALVDVIFDRGLPPWQPWNYESLVRYWGVSQGEALPVLVPASKPKVATPVRLPPAPPEPAVLRARPPLHPEQERANLLQRAQVYADASLRERGAVAAILYLPQAKEPVIVRGGGLDSASTAVLELQAALLALESIDRLAPDCAIDLHLDNQAALTTLHRHRAYEVRDRHLTGLLPATRGNRWLYRILQRTQLYWVRGHAGYNGNELADQVARATTAMEATGTRTRSGVAATTESLAELAAQGVVPDVASLLAAAHPRPRPWVTEATVSRAARRRAGSKALK